MGFHSTGDETAVSLDQIFTTLVVCETPSKMDGVFVS